VRAVVDTNLFVSGLLWGRNPGRLMAAAQAGTLRLCSSEILLAELGRVLSRAKFSAFLIARGVTAEAVLASARSLCEIFDPPAMPMPAELRDPNDLAVLACAVSAEADLIITGDKDLLAPSSSLFRLVFNFAFINNLNTVRRRRLWGRGIGRSGGAGFRQVFFCACEGGAGWLPRIRRS